MRLTGKMFNYDNHAKTEYSSVMEKSKNICTYKIFKTVRAFSFVDRRV